MFVAENKFNPIVAINFFFQPLTYSLCVYRRQTNVAQKSRLNHLYVMVQNPVKVAGSNVQRPEAELVNMHGLI